MFVKLTPIGRNGRGTTVYEIEVDTTMVPCVREFERLVREAIWANDLLPVMRQLQLLRKAPEP